MFRRRLGRQGLEVPAIGLGCMGMSFAYGQADPAESLRVLERSLELGMDHWDTAEIYGPFKNEELIGRFLAASPGRRERVLLASKFAWRFSPDGERIGLDGSAANMRRAVEGSLKRLDTDRIDLYYLHRKDPNVPIEETVGAMAELVKEGKVRFLGLSEVGPETLRRAHATHPISALQSEYSLWETPLKARVLPVLRELGIGLVAYSPFGRGFLAGGMKPAEAMGRDDIRRTFPRFQKDHAPANARLVDAVRRFAAARGATAAQLCIAWLIAQGDDIVTIPGTTRADHLEEDAGAAELRLTPDDMTAIERLLADHPPSGPRLPEGMMKLISAE
jgi:aryl-alcohol dehydrogenase-like predicted oxidoreductase